MRFKDKVIVITGAAQGIGRGFALAFGREGGHVVVADINENAAKSVAGEISEVGGSAAAFAVDVSSEASARALANFAQEKFGRVDVLINNAAFFSTLKMKPFHEIDEAEWDRVFAVNTKGVFLVTKAVSRLMVAQKSGRIINVSSGAVEDGRPNYLHYISSKSAITGMTRGLASELGAHAINVNTISPYGIATEVPRETITPAQWEKIIGNQAIHVQGTTDSMVGAALFLASDDAAFVTGQTLHVNGGTIFH